MGALLQILSTGTKLRTMLRNGCPRWGAWRAKVEGMGRHDNHGYGHVGAVQGAAPKVIQPLVSPGCSVRRGLQDMQGHNMVDPGLSRRWPDMRALALVTMNGVAPVWSRC